MSETTPTEGWAMPALSAKKFHYFRDNRSLCGKYAYVSMIAGPLQPDTPGLGPGPDDCKACTTKKEKTA